ncbi:MAG: DUF2591 family protein [Polaromonas sp.]|nr:DUF2591 family protein [Polaromonas sp.]
MKVKTSTASGRTLDVMVAMALGCTLSTVHSELRQLTAPGRSEEEVAALLAKHSNYPVTLNTVGNMEPLQPYSSSPEAGHGILEREGISIMKASPTEQHWGARYAWDDGGRDYYGGSILEAGLRCFAAKKLGIEVDVHEELLA